MNTQVTDWEKIFTIHNLQGTYTQNIYKQLLQLSNKKRKQPHFFKGVKEFTRKINEQPVSKWKEVLNIKSHQGIVN